MMIISNTLSTFIKNGLRQIKVLAYGKTDVREAHQVGPFGDDSNPVANMQAIYAPTSNSGEPVIIGYINKENIAAIGEKRMFSTNENGDLSFFIHMKNDGTCEINGTGDNLIRYQEVDNYMQKLKTDINTELVKIQTGITGAGGAYTPTSILIDTSKSKIEEIETTVF